ncbi:hypothetical protein AC1031_003005 [Aphanomyces cochlioides]|nr:hypothetical protein AC1031_003005 [Aphanomyces cochlioides]
MNTNVTIVVNLASQTQVLSSPDVRAKISKTCDNKSKTVTRPAWESYKTPREAKEARKITIIDPKPSRPRPKKPRFITPKMKILKRKHDRRLRQHVIVKCMLKAEHFGIKLEAYTEEIVSD